MIRYTSAIVLLFICFAPSKWNALSWMFVCMIVFEHDTVYRYLVFYFSFLLSFPWQLPHIQLTILARTRVYEWPQRHHNHKRSLFMLASVSDLRRSHINFYPILGECSVPFKIYKLNNLLGTAEDHRSEAHPAYSDGGFYSQKPANVLLTSIDVVSSSA